MVGPSGIPERLASRPRVLAGASTFSSTMLIVAVGAAGVGFEPTIEVAPDAGFQDVVLVLVTSCGEIGSAKVRDTYRAEGDERVGSCASGLEFERRSPAGRTWTETASSARCQARFGRRRARAAQDD
jgi:hypothetical protein